MSDLHPLDAFELGRPRTLFVLYGCRKNDGERTGPYFKLAYSLREAIADLLGNPGMAYTGYVVSDAFVETEQDGSPVIHVELLTIDDLREMIGTDEE